MRSFSLPKVYKKVLLPASVLAATIIGAGVFALPYAFTVSGALAGVGYVVLAAAAYGFVYLMYADVIVRTPGRHRFIGYAAAYFGRAGFWFGAATTLFGMVFTLTVYLVLSISFLSLAFPAMADVYKLLIFWLLGSLGLLWREKRLVVSEFFITASMLAIIGVVFLLGFGRFDGFVSGAPLTFAAFLFPLGPILFAFSGRTAIPELVDYFKLTHTSHDYVGMRRAISIGTIAPAVAYLLFVVGVFGLSPDVSTDTVTGLTGQVPLFVILLIGALGFLALWSSYIAVGFDARMSLGYDLKFSRTWQTVTVVGAPLLLYFLGFQSFIALVSFVGGVFLALEGMAMIVIWRWARKRNPGQGGVLRGEHKFLSLLSLAVFTAALLYVMFAQRFL